MVNVAENIRQIRIEKGITQGVVADALGVDVASVSRIETGKQELKVSQLENISKVLQTEIIDLFTYPKKYIDKSTIKDAERVLISFEVSPKKRDELLKLVNDL